MSEYGKVQHGNITVYGTDNININLEVIRHTLCGFLQPKSFFKLKAFNLYVKEI